MHSRRYVSDRMPPKVWRGHIEHEFFGDALGPFERAPYVSMRRVNAPNYAKDCEQRGSRRSRSRHTTYQIIPASTSAAERVWCHTARVSGKLRRNWDVCGQLSWVELQDKNRRYRFVIADLIRLLTLNTSLSFFFFYSHPWNLFHLVSK